MCIVFFPYSVLLTRPFHGTLKARAVAAYSRNSFIVFRSVISTFRALHATGPLTRVAYYLIFFLFVALHRPAFSSPPAFETSKKDGDNKNCFSCRTQRSSTAPSLVSSTLTTYYYRFVTEKRFVFANIFSTEIFIRTSQFFAYV